MRYGSFWFGTLRSPVWNGRLRVGSVKDGIATVRPGMDGQGGMRIDSAVLCVISLCLTWNGAMGFGEAVRGMSQFGLVRRVLVGLCEAHPKTISGFGVG